MKILIVEDDFLIRKVAISILKKLNCEVSSADNGEEALSLYSPEWDLVFMDCQMPVLNGLEATQRWRELEKASELLTHVPIIALTSESDDAERLRCIAAGMDDFVCKPLKIDILKVILHKWVSKSHTEVPIQHLSSNGTLSLSPLDELLAEYKGFESLLRQLAQTYSNEWPQIIKSLQEEIRVSNAHSVFQLAHKLKGQTLTLRFDGLTKVAQKIESHAKLEEWGNIYAEVPKLERELEKGIDWLQSIAYRIDSSNEN